MRKFLTPGESFQESIDKILHSSKLFALLVTPNLLEGPDGKPNYVMAAEYPAAKASGIDIFPAEMEFTDKASLTEKYQGIPNCVPTCDENAFQDALLAAVQKAAITTNNTDPEHMFLVGLAYWDGIDVEVDRARGIELITAAAENRLPEATKALGTKKCVRPMPPTRPFTGQGSIWNTTSRSAAKTIPIRWLPCFLLRKSSTNITLATRQYACAKKLHKKAYALRCKVFGEDSANVLFYLDRLMNSYRRRGDQKNADRLEKKINALEKKRREQQEAEREQRRARQKAERADNTANNAKLEFTAAPAAPERPVPAPPQKSYWQKQQEQCQQSYAILPLVLGEEDEGTYPVEVSWSRLDLNTETVWEDATCEDDKDLVALLDSLGRMGADIEYLDFHRADDTAKDMTPPGAVWVPDATLVCFNTDSDRLAFMDYLREGGFQFAELDLPIADELPTVLLAIFDADHCLNELVNDLFQCGRVVLMGNMNYSPAGGNTISVTYVEYYYGDMVNPWFSEFNSEQYALMGDRIVMFEDAKYIRVDGYMEEIQRANRGDMNIRLPLSELFARGYVRQTEQKMAEMVEINDEYVDDMLYGDIYDT